MSDVVTLHTPSFRLGTQCRTLIHRAIRLSLRNEQGITVALVLPVILLLMFVYLFGGALAVGTHYVDYVVPGILLVCASFGAGSTAVSLSEDLSGGIIDRFRSMDVRGETFVLSHVVASVARNVISTALVLGLAFAVGFRSGAGPAAWIGALALLILFVLALSTLAAALGIVAKSPEGASGLTFLIAFLPYASSAFVPIHSMPGWLRTFTANQPETAVADSMRDLFLGQPVGTAPWHAVIWSVAILVASLAASGVLFRRRLR
jgi:ABC-2 type transport system permease protein